MHSLAMLLVCLQQIANGTAVAAPGIETTSPAVAYQPRGFVPGLEEADGLLAQITEDLRLLRTAGFRSLVTYGAYGDLGAIPRLARDQGFDDIVILGVWDPLSDVELSNAIAEAEYVDGYCVGNEGLDSRYSPDELAAAMQFLRVVTGKPVTTTEPIDRYLSGTRRNWLISNSDWLFPLAHPFWADRADSREAVEWILARYDLLRAQTNRHVVLKEAGAPSGGLDAYSEESQLRFYQLLERQMIDYFRFEAFDQPWKSTAGDRRAAAEPHWGLFRADGSPKAAARWLTSSWAGK